LVLVLVLDKAASKWAFSGLALVFALFAVGIYYSGAPTADIGYPLNCFSYGGGSTWTAGGECGCRDDDIMLNGTLSITGGGEFKMSNCTLRINSSYAGQYGILIDNEGLNQNFTMANGSLITYGSNASAGFIFNITSDDGFLTMVAINNSEIRGAGISSARFRETGVYIYGANLTMLSATIDGGYNGLILNRTNNSYIWNTTVSGNSNLGILVSKSNYTNITGGTVRDNGNYGLLVNGSKNVSVFYNNIINNSRGGVYANGSTSPIIMNNYIFLNGGNGITANLSTNTINYPIWNNVIVNNSGWAVSMYDLSTLGAVEGNTMCFNSNTTYWNLAGTPYTSPAGLIQYNIFCVNISRPVKNSCTASATVSFYVSGNPLSWYTGGATGHTDCTLTIDNNYMNHTSPTIPGAYETVNLMFNATNITQGHHTLAVHCDPYQNVADDSTEYNQDNNGPTFSFGGKTGDCDTVTLSVHWYENTCNISTVVLSTNETSAYKNYTNGTYGSPATIDLNDSLTSFSWWNASMENGWINWLVWANDSAGNWNSTNISENSATFQAIKCTSSNVNTGGGGGGGGGGVAVSSGCTVDKGNMKIASVAKDQSVACRLDGVFTLFNLTFAEAMGPSSLALGETYLPASVSAPGALVYRYFSLASVNLTDSKLTSVKVDFSVPNGWLEENNVDPKTVKLYSWNGEGWSVEPTVAGVEGANSTKFYASLQSIETDTFAVVAAKECACPASSGWGECKDNKESRIEWACSAETLFDCANYTRTRNCVCPESCTVPSDWSACTDGTRNRTAYSCSEGTDFECVPQQESGPCSDLPQLLMPMFEDFKGQPLIVQAVIVLVAVGIVAGGVGLYFVKVRKYPLQGKIKGLLNRKSSK